MGRGSVGLFRFPSPFAAPCKACLVDVACPATGDELLRGEPDERDRGLDQLDLRIGYGRADDSRADEVVEVPVDTSIDVWMDDVAGFVAPVGIEGGKSAPPHVLRLGTG